MCHVVSDCFVFIGSATGNPTPQITWKLDGFPLPEVCIGIFQNLNFQRSLIKQIIFKFFPFQICFFFVIQVDRLLIGQYVTLFGDVISHVNITAVKSEDGGSYECTAVSKAGSASHSGRLNIYGKMIFSQKLNIFSQFKNLLNVKM